MQSIDIERVLLWLIETREPNLYKFIQSRRYTFVEGDSITQAKILTEEFLMEANDSNIDKELSYKNLNL